MARPPYVGSGKIPQGSTYSFATHKQDFVSHASGGGFRHTADNIDMNPPIAVGGATVQEALENLNAIFTGGHYVIIGDGVNSFGDYNVGDPATPTIEDCFIAAQADSRITSGGWIYIHAGIYNFVDVVNLNPGVSIMGSAGGTILNINVSSPKSMFFVPASTTYNLGGTTVEGYTVNRFLNLTFADNFNNPTSPYLLLASSAFIRVAHDSVVDIERCTVLGNVKTGVDSTQAKASRCFVAYASAATTYGNTLKITNCVIQGVEKVVNYGVSITRKNTFEFVNNRVYFFGTTANTHTYAIVFNACNASLIGNRFKFTMLNTGNLGVIPVCFEVDGTPGDTVDILITNNQLDSSVLVAGETNQLLLCNDAVGLGDKKRFRIHGNLVGGVCDFDWYLVVGDGDTSLGDINGTLALNYLSTLFSNNMINIDPTYSNFVNNITVYLRPGEYKITSTYDVTGLGTKLIGLTESGNVPIVWFDGPSAGALGGITLDTTANTINVIFGSHIENIYFKNLDINNYIRIVLFTGYGNLDTRIMYSEQCVAKNCLFLSCGLYPRTNSAMGNKEIQTIVTVDSCRFESNFDKYTSIILDKGKSLFQIRNCVWERSNLGSQFYGHFINNKPAWNAAEDYDGDYAIENCYFYTGVAGKNPFIASDRSLIRLQNVQTFSMKDCTFDCGNIGANIDYMINISDGNQTYSRLDINNCKFVGPDDASATSVTLPITGIYIERDIGSCNICNNTFNNVPLSIEAHHLNVSVSTHAYNINIDNNNCYLGTKGFTFCFVFDMFSSEDYGKTSICGNVVNGEDTVVADILDPGFSSVTNAIGMITYASDITMVFPKSKVNIDNNFIYGKNSNNIASAQTPILSNGAYLSNICNNSITFQSDDIVDTFGIKCIEYSYSFSVYAPLPNSSCDISGNNINMNVTALAGNESFGIYVQNVHFLNITKNTILANADDRITNFIKAYNNPLYYVSGFFPPAQDGNIVDNIFNTSLEYELSNDGAGTVNETFRKEVVVHDEGVETYDTRIRAEYNKNQKDIVDINCTEFKLYGKNMFYPETVGPMLLARDNSIFSSGGAGNRVKTSQHLIDDDSFGFVAGAGNEIATADWASLPDGLYFTNIWRNAYNCQDPMIEVGTVMPPSVDYHYQNQIIIPLTSLPRRSEIIGIDIPIYYASFTANDVVVKTSAALMMGNYVSDSTISTGSGVNYLSDDPVLAAWAINSTTISGGPGTSEFVRISNDLLNNSASRYNNEAWIDRAPGGNSYGIPTANFYIMLTINRIVDVNNLEFDRVLGFAIPYARVIIKY